MSQEFDHVPVAELEALIKRLPTVLRSHVAVNEWGAIEEIHVLTTLDRSPKQIVRDVESALLAQWGLRVDHKKVSVAQIMDDRATRPLARLTVVEFRIDLDTVHQNAQGYVRLQPADDTTTAFEGRWHGRYVPSQYHNIMAWATVDAVNQIPELAQPVVLTELRTFQMAGRTIVAVALSYVTNKRKEEVLIGAAPERGDGQGAAVRAVLDAVNRRLGQIERPVPKKVLGSSEELDERKDEE
ncbi:hypothetical protein BXT84_05920 [Sulfobacillus thermotolerans]|uniref:Uncharacterized protein n=1 Tax=Sulfobacillus thermotolerans TaxID=338644 RepID=A0ABM6RQ52_9FIRM|nr:hypothetical protein BXT84_05920 [Sulfobacillus thermotolerans]